MRVATLALCLLGLATPARADEPAAALAPPEATPAPAPTPAPTQAPPSHESFALELGVATTLPLVVGGIMGFEVPGHVVIRVGGGMVPAAYVDAINSVGVGWSAYGDDAAHVASALLVDSMWFEVGLAIRPAGTPGLELAVSYALLWNHQARDASQVGGPSRRVGLDVIIDAVHGELAWQSIPIEHVFFRIALGWVQAFEHRVTLAAEGDATEQAALEAAGDALAVTVGRYAFGPTLGASLGVRLD